MRYLKIVFACMLIFLLQSCSRDDDSIESTGQLNGTVQTWDDKLTSTNELGGIQVTVANGITRTTLTDANGRYVFDDLPFDTYQVTFSKTGYGTHKVFGIDHSPSINRVTTIPQINFGKNATTAISAFALVGNTYNGVPGVQFLLSFQPEPTSGNRAYFRYFLATTPDVGPANYRYYSPVRSASNNSSAGGFTADELYAMGFRAGQQVYARVYGESVISNDYTDPNLGLRIFPNLNSNTVNGLSFIVP